MRTLHFKVAFDLTRSPSRIVTLSTVLTSSSWCASEAPKRIGFFGGFPCSFVVKKEQPSHDQI